MDDVRVVGWVGNMVVTSLLQTIGFFSPSWVCNIDKFNQSLTNDSCEIQGLFYPSGIVDEDVFWLCTISWIVSLICTVITFVWFVGNTINDEYAGPGIKAVPIIFLICQFLAGVANVILFVRYDVLGWSAILFFTFAFPVIVVVVYKVASICYDAYEKSKTRD